jgi:hypothetical protein
MDDVCMVVTFEQPQSLTGVTRLALAPLRDVVSFGLDRSAAWSSVKIRLEDGVAGSTAGSPIDLELVRPFLHPPDPDSAVIFPPSMLFSLVDHPVGWSGLLPAWLRLVEKASNATDILLGIKYAPPAFTDNRLILLAEAAEAYHRRLFPDRGVSAASLRNAEMALASVDERVGEWLRLKLRHATEPSLRARLADLVRLARPAIDALVSRKDPLALEVSRIRNLYAHHGADPTGPEGAEVYLLNQKLEWVLRVNLLRHLGWRSPALETLVSRNEALSQITGRLSG